jgi:voltage-gated potassium channel Kch
MATSQELLFLFAIGWGFGVASLFEYGGFSIEVGSLFAGVSLASLPYAQEIEARLKPLRDFFVVLFFITLGESLTLSNMSAAIVPALALSAVVIVLKPAVVTTTLGLLGYTKRVSFKAGINLSQISEFSIVLIVLAVSAGLVGEQLSSVVTIVAMITITTSTYLMQYDERLFRIFDKLRLFYGIFDFERRHKEARVKTGYQLFLFGYHRGGHEFVKTFRRLHRKRFLVIDYNPAVIDSLQHQQIPCMYGDATDTELLAEVGIHEAKLIVSTISDFEVNQELVKHINLINSEAVVICNATNSDEALQLYELGCTYVIVPHHLGTEKLGSIITEKGIDKESYRHYRERHLSSLEARQTLATSEEGI